MYSIKPMLTLWRSSIFVEFAVQYVFNGLRVMTIDHHLNTALQKLIILRSRNVFKRQDTLAACTRRHLTHQGEQLFRLPWLLLECIRHGLQTSHYFRGWVRDEENRK